jgi:excisionase family DNA binding protein
MSADEQESTFLPPREAAALAGLSTRAIYRAIQRGELRALRLCSRLRIARADFDEWLERSVVPAQRATTEIRRPPVAPVRGSLRQLLGHGQGRRGQS